jgi:hypothetical protein
MCLASVCLKVGLSWLVLWFTWLSQRFAVFDFSSASGWVVISGPKCYTAGAKSDRVIKIGGSLDFCHSMWYKALQHCKHLGVDLSLGFYVHCQFTGLLL